MLCPICNLDLTPLDAVSRTEHVNVCLEGGPTTSRAFETNGHLIGARPVDASKQRTICPVCSKTFQNVNNHFKLCAFKNDIPPHLLMDYWDKINEQNKDQAARPFPRELLDNFILKCLKEGRVGADVEYAQALSMSLAETEKKSKKRKNVGWSINLQQIQQKNPAQPIVIDETSQMSAGGDNLNDDGETLMTIDGDDSNLPPRENVATAAGGPVAPTELVLKPSICVVNMMRNETKKQQMLQETTIQIGGNSDAVQQVLKPQTTKNVLTLNQLRQDSATQRKPHRLELITSEDRSATIELRVERELAASRSWRKERGPRQTNEDDDDVVDFYPEFLSPVIPDLWFKSRLAMCDATTCQDSDCRHADLIFVLEEFSQYSSIKNSNGDEASAAHEGVDNEEDANDELQAEIVNDHANLSGNLLGLVNKQWMADMLIKSGYTKFYAHKLIWFTRTFKNNRPTITLDNLPAIDMSDFRPDVIKHLLNYIYGSVLPSDETMMDLCDDLKSLASRLGCQNLVDMINTVMKGHRSHELGTQRSQQHNSSFRLSSGGTQSDRIMIG